VFAEPTQLSLRNDGGLVMTQRVVPVSFQDASQTGANIPMRVPVASAPEKH
jgi:hypothetical protein